MLIFPITRKPITPWQEEREDNVLRSQKDAGYKVTRPRFSRTMSIMGPFTWQHLTDADYQTLMNFYDNQTGGGSDMFQFSVSTRTRTITKIVRFTGPPKATYIGLDKWLVECTFEEV